MKIKKKVEYYVCINFLNKKITTTKLHQTSFDQITWQRWVPPHESDLIKIFHPCDEMMRWDTDFFVIPTGKNVWTLCSWIITYFGGKWQENTWSSMRCSLEDDNGMPAHLSVHNINLMSITDVRQVTGAYF